MVAEDADEGGGYLRGPAAALRFLGKWITRGADREDGALPRSEGGRARAWAEFALPAAAAPQGNAESGSPAVRAEAAALAAPVCVEGDGWAMPDAIEPAAPGALDAARERIVEVYHATPGALAGGLTLVAWFQRLCVRVRPRSAAQVESLELQFRSALRGWAV